MKNKRNYRTEQGRTGTIFYQRRTAQEKKKEIILHTKIIFSIENVSNSLVKRVLDCGTWGPVLNSRVRRIYFPSKLK